MYQALWSCLACVVVTVAVSLATTPKPDAELRGLVYSLTEIPAEDRVSWIRRPLTWALVALAMLLILQWWFW
jgi:SSS family solute:Na+ symporter